MNLKCLLVDDEPRALQVLEDYVTHVPFLTLAGSFRNPVTALGFLQNNSVDILFLDINMPGLSGLEFLKALKNPPLVIFTTAYSEYALESYDFDAVDYLLKPIEYDRFLKAAGKALEKHQSKARSEHTAAEEEEKFPLDDAVLIKSGTTLHKLRRKDILFIEAAGNYVIVVTPIKSVMSLLTLKKAEKILSPGPFIRIHKSYIINFDHVDVVEKDCVRIGDKRISVGREYRDLFQKIIKSTEFKKA